jgi:hypothetical protein
MEFLKPSLWAIFSPWPRLRQTWSSIDPTVSFRCNVASVGVQAHACVDVGGVARSRSLERVSLAPFPEKKL